jgi:hypothetical protein
MHGANPVRLGNTPKRLLTYQPLRCSWRQFVTEHRDSIIDKLIEIRFFLMIGS